MFFDNSITHYLSGQDEIRIWRVSLNREIVHRLVGQNLKSEKCKLSGH